MSIISIIVPVYNVEKYLNRCIDSILEQTFTDYELILVNDGSKDNSGKICDEYAKKDSRIKVIHQNNKGLSAARNEGIKLATGKYCMFCDSDDYVAKTWCEKLVEEIRMNPDTWIVSNVFRDEMKQIKQQQEKMVKATYFEIYKSGLSPYVWNKIYDLRKIKQNNIWFDETCKYAEDVEFNVKYCKTCSEIIYVSTPLYYYCYNDESITHTYRQNLFELHLPLFWYRLPLINDTEMTEYCDIWLYQFMHLFDNVFDSRNKMNLLQKLKYNQKMISSKEFKYCLNNASGKNESSLIIRLYKTYNYYIVWLVQKIIKIKNKWRN